MAYKDLIGKHFGRLTVISRVQHTRKDGSFGWKWQCACSCGGVTYSTTGILNSGTHQSCGCALKERTRSKHPQWTGYGEISGQHWSMLQIGAKKRALDFDISIEHAWTLFLLQDRKCRISGLPLQFKSKARGGTLGTASLDRIDSQQGYIFGNIQWVHVDINYMKNDHSEAEFIKLCSLVTKHNRLMSHDIHKTLASLPVKAYVWVDGQSCIGVVELGQRGYIPYTLCAQTIENLARLNEAIGVTPQQSEAMMVGSMYGWNTPSVQDALDG